MKSPLKPRVTRNRLIAAAVILIAALAILIPAGAEPVPLLLGMLVGAIAVALVAWFMSRRG